MYLAVTVLALGYVFWLYTGNKDSTDGAFPFSAAAVTAGTPSWFTKTMFSLLLAFSVVLLAYSTYLGVCSMKSNLAANNAKVAFGAQIALFCLWAYCFLAEITTHSQSHAMYAAVALIAVCVWQMYTFWASNKVALYLQLPLVLTLALCAWVSYRIRT